MIHDDVSNPWRLSMTERQLTTLQYVYICILMFNPKCPYNLETERYQQTIREKHTHSARQYIVAVAVTAVADRQNG